MRAWTAPDGARIAYRMNGAGPGHPVVLLHSLFFDGTMFDAILPRLSDRVTLRPDHRGQGASEAGSEAPTAERLAHDVLGVMDAQGVGAIHLVGSSMGGYVALELMRAAPDRVATLTLSCCTCRVEADPARFAGLADRIAAAEGRGLGAELERLMFADELLRDPARAEARARWLARFDALPEGMDAVVRAIFAHGGWMDLLRGWGGPILAISGAADRAKAPADLAWIAREGLGRHVVIEAAGHTPAVETPEAFADALAGFIRDRDGRDAA